MKKKQCDWVRIPYPEAMICVIEIEKRYGQETALAALAELRLYTDKLDHMLNDGSRTSH